MNSIIEVKENNSNLIEFSLLSGGDFFIYNHELCMKLPKSFKQVHNAVAIKTCNTFEVEEFSKVQLVDVKIEYTYSARK